MDVRFPRVFLVRVLVGLVSVRHGRMVVLVPVGRHQMRDVLIGTMVVGDVDVLVRVDLGIVMMGLGHFSSLLGRCWRARGRSLSAVLLAFESRGCDPSH
jgi:hypothetical protein